MIEPGMLWQNSTTESFNEKFRDECLSMEWIGNCLEARNIKEVWRRHYDDIPTPFQLEPPNRRQFAEP